MGSWYFLTLLIEAGTGPPCLPCYTRRLFLV